MQMTIGEVCDKARRYERESLVVYRGALGLTALFIAAFSYRLATVREPWLIAGSGLTVATFCCMVWKLLWKGPNKMSAAEPCLDFLRREFEGKRRGLLWVRNCLLLLLPAMLASWWGHGPVLGARILGVQSPWLLSILEGPAPFILVSLVVAFVWFAFSRQARKVEGWIEKLGRE